MVVGAYKDQAKDFSRAGSQQLNIEGGARLNPVYLAALQRDLSQGVISKTAAASIGDASSQQSKFSYIKELFNSPLGYRILAFAPITIPNLQNRCLHKDSSNNNFVKFSFTGDCIDTHGKQWFYELRWHTITNDEDGGTFPTWVIERADTKSALQNISSPSVQVLTYLGNSDLFSAYTKLNQNVTVQEPEGNGVVWIPRTLKGVARANEADRGLQRRLDAAMHWPWIPSEMGLRTLVSDGGELVYNGASTPHTFFCGMENRADLEAFERISLALLSRWGEFGDKVSRYLVEHLLLLGKLPILSSQSLTYFKAIEDRLPLYKPNAGGDSRDLQAVLQVAIKFAPEKVWDVIDCYLDTLSSAAQSKLSSIRANLKEQDIGQNPSKILEALSDKISEIQKAKLHPHSTRLTRRGFTLVAGTLLIPLIVKNGCDFRAEYRETKRLETLAQKECEELENIMLESFANDPELESRFKQAAPTLATDIWDKLSNLEFIQQWVKYAAIQSESVSAELKREAISAISTFFKDFKHGYETRTAAMHKLRTAIENLKPDETLIAPYEFSLAQMNELIEDNGFIGKVLGYQPKQLSFEIQAETLDKIRSECKVSYLSLDRSLSKTHANIADLKPTRDITYHADVSLLVKVSCADWSNTTELRARAGAGFVFNQQYSNQAVPIPVQADKSEIIVTILGTYDVNTPDHNPGEPILNMSEQELFRIPVGKVQSALDDIEASGNNSSVLIGATSGPVVFDFKMPAGHPDPQHPDLVGTVQISIVPIFVKSIRELTASR